MSEEQNIEKKTENENSPPAGRAGKIEGVTGHFPEDTHAAKKETNYQQPDLPKTPADIPATESMETHAHHLHKVPGKNFWHYFFEFLMLFLAVTLGFFVENQREHYIEHKRARQYASTMLEDLKADNEALFSGIKNNQLIINRIDTLLFLYNPDNKQIRTTGQLYYFGRHGIRFWHYVNKQVTLEQMKHSGTIGYFQNSFLENKFVALDKEINFIQYWENREATFREQSLQYATSLFNYAVLNTLPVDTVMLETNEQQFTNNFLQTNPPLNNDKLVNEFLNFCNLRLSLLKAKIMEYKEALDEMEALTKVLRREFRLK